MCSKQNRKFKYTCFWYDYKKKWIKNFNKRYHANANVNLMVENITQIKSGITINFDASVKIQKNKMCVKTIIFGILSQAVVKMVNI